MWGQTEKEGGNQRDEIGVVSLELVRNACMKQQNPTQKEDEKDEDELDS